MPTDRSIIDEASGGALIDKTPEAARQLISNMTANSTQFGTRGDFPSKRVNEANISNLENKVNDLTSLVHSLACGNVQQVKVCSICSLQGHTSDMCPTMPKDYIEQANAVDGAFNGQLHHKYDPISNTYNPGYWPSSFILVGIGLGF
jgi:recombinational DNA repair protein RecR